MSSCLSEENSGDSEETKAEAGDSHAASGSNSWGGG